MIVSVIFRVTTFDAMNRCVVSHYRWGCESRFSKNTQLGGTGKVVCSVPLGIKSTEMNVSDLYLFKKSKIIKIDSVKKNL